MTMTSADTARRTQTPPLQGRGKGWGIDAQTLTDLQRRARAMRNNPTEPELRLWRNLSNGQLAGWKFRRQQVIGRAIVDFYCPYARLVVEVDGDTHDDPTREARRDAYLRQFGLTVLHVGNADVMGNMEGVLQVIGTALDARKTPPLQGRGTSREAAEGAGGVDRAPSRDCPHPNPSPEGEGLDEAISMEGSAG